MKCIIVTEDYLMKTNIEKLIVQSDNLYLLSTFNTTSEASKFMSDNCIDVLFFDIQMCDFDSIEFIYSIPENTFIIYVPEADSFINTYKTINKKDFSDSMIVKRFKQGVDEAHVFLNLIKKETPDISDNYFII